MKINGVEFEGVDFTDAEFVEKFDKGCEKVGKAGKELENKKDITPAEGIRQECKIIKEFFDYVFGEGASQKAFGDRNSLKECLDAYEDVVKTAVEQYDDYNKRLNKYSPERLKR